MRNNFRYQHLVASNRKFAKQVWGDFLDPQQMRSLTEITRYFGFSIAMREILLLQGGWYVTHAGLVRLAKRRYCAGIDVAAVPEFCDPIAARWSFKATVYKSKNGKGFVGHGDADPSNVSFLVRGAEMRVAETRAVNRALRKAYGIGLCSVEELGALPSVRTPSSATPFPAKGSPSPNGNGQPRLRDQLCLLIRQFKLDPSLVKSYAADFCGAKAISDASRESVETFVSHLKKAAEENREGLICKLNSYSARVEGGK
jgi:hypothetical protein